MKYFALFIGNFPTYSITLRAANITEVVSQIEKSYSFTQGPMHLEIYNSDKKLIKTLYPFKLEGYTKECPCGKKPHYCNFNADPWDFYWDDYDYEIYERTRKFNEGEEDYDDEEEYYDDEEMQEIEENNERRYIYHKNCPYRKVCEIERKDRHDYRDRTEWVIMYAECCIPLETRYVFAPSLKSAKKLERKFFKYPVSTTKI